MAYGISLSPNRIVISLEILDDLPVLAANAFQHLVSL
jgi:hypothetical protein